MPQCTGRARRSYYAYASGQLSRAVESIPSGSRALQALGKVYGIPSHAEVVGAGDGHAKRPCSTRPPCSSIRGITWLPMIWRCNLPVAAATTMHAIAVPGLATTPQPACAQPGRGHAQLSEPDHAARARRAALATSNGVSPVANPAVAAWQSRAGRSVDFPHVAATSDLQDAGGHQASSPAGACR